MNSIEIIQVSDRRKLQEFILLPSILHKRHVHWVPPLYFEERQYFNRKNNLAFRYCEVIQALAYHNGQPAGRIMGVINRRHNQANHLFTARFCLLECINNQFVAHKLFKLVEEWASGYGMTEIIGPFGMNYHDPIGFIVDGFEHKPALTTYCNFDYINELVSNEGYSTFKDLTVYKIMIPDKTPAIYTRIASRISGNHHITLAAFSSRRDLKPYILPVLKLMNETYANIFGYSQLDTDEMIRLAKQYLPVLDPDLVKIAECRGEVIGFIIAMPNISNSLKASKGHLFPFGVFRILKEAKKANQLDLLIGAIKNKYQGMGVDVLMGMEMINTARKRGFEFIDSHLEMDTNLKVRAEMVKVGGKPYKKYRLYSKILK